ncbi:hypothetical protein [Candidatus Leptofilum sp.]|uniref:hypothetical protein n=1 Tax=Candidatus Leptofilum sp. TaxID=3241576 RepID=UPI003B58C872
MSLIETAVPATITPLPTATVVPASSSTLQPTALPAATPTHEATVLPTATPAPAYDLLPGMIFSQDGVYFRIDTSGQLATLFEQPETNVLSFSPDGRYLIYTDFNDNLLYLRDLVQGESRPIFSEPLADARLRDWREEEPQWALLSIAPTQAYVNAWFGGGLPALVNLDALKTTMLIPEFGSALQQFTDAAVSPTGEQIAFDIAGQGWLYEFELGARPFDPADYGLPLLGDPQYSLRNPTFSPNGRFLVWQIKNYQLWDGYVPDEYEFGVAVFDLERQTAVTIPNLILSAADHNYIPPMRWVGDDNLLIYGLIFPQGDLATASSEAWNYRTAYVHLGSGQVIIFTGERVIQSIASDAFLTVRSLGQPADGFVSPGELLIESLADGTVTVAGLIELTQPTLFAPDGRTILFGDQQFDLGSRTLQPLNLPPDLQLVTWTAVP